MKPKTTFLKFILAGLVAFILFLSFLLTMGLLFSINEHSVFPEQVLASISLYLSAIASLLIIYYMYRMLVLVDNDRAFSAMSLIYVRAIFRLTIMEFIVLIGTVPFVYYIADNDDAPGVMIIGLGMLIIPLAVATFVSIIEKLLKNAIELKLDYELTI
ncbi:hypothetical protein K5E_22700 [Enterococcus thailandicus]|uniref:DUF2975 domain-containing protein n=2 Tax=root TaxID=1 RepID=A0A510WH99_ENTTH|nr:DUF2975 domain-containing protein [Enterococcus thailandicus]MDK4351958.1 DUF2975 domain-containing protein [Enterococcus thailandicus]MDT2733893.1 DUF2975 domain-containing protein [Enterococcus thailandicus]MEA4830465.1 DUF2975 domain-containing protein [Enterococcus thailandicus]OJG95048.1 hypothetical protein RV17_GL002107 [Enterococcus thailandicus]GEK37025.1 hypothetical protein ETH01_13120 [Enterococcus thailandicus]